MSTNTTGTGTAGPAAGSTGAGNNNNNNNKAASARPQAEDAAGEGGEAVATFSNYNAPLWARRVAAAAAAVAAEHKNEEESPKNKRKKNEDGVICIDVDDSSDEEDEGNNDNKPTASKKDTTDLESMESHTSPASESGLLASVSAPTPEEECLTVLRQICTEGKLSPLQIEGAGLAIQRHCRLLAAGSDSGTTPNDDGNGHPRRGQKVRAGFFLGDGAGIGKGRQIAAVIRDSYCRSIKSQQIRRRRRHLWLSVSRELVEDARRDMEDIGCYAPVIDGATALSGNKVVSDDSGVLFVTYALLTSGKGKRMEDIINWLIQGSTGFGKSNKKEQESAFDGCIVFDEAHKAKNLSMDPPTATGKLVLSLQQRLPNARVMYCSATGVSDLKHMAYACRLGLWGPGTNFPMFQNFKASLERRGVGAMEMLALEMKQAGCFVARTLSWDGAEFNTVKANLSVSEIQIYDEAMQWWALVMQELKAAIARPGMDGRVPRMIWSNYWSALQRFCKELAICAKVPWVVDDALKQLDMGHSVVIGLQSTGEASTQATLEELQSKLSIQNGRPIQDLEEVSLPGLLSTSAAIMGGFVRTHFPVAPEPMEPVPMPSKPPNGFACEDDQNMYEARVRRAEMINNMPPHPPIPELLRKKKELLDAITDIALPPAPLDDLIDRLGGVDNVSEMTGRSGRVIRSEKGNGFRFVKRGANGAATKQRFALSAPVSEEDKDRLNIVEKKKFMDGRRKVAIISDAASTGISLHAAKTSVACDRRRTHYTIELPWAADKAIQQLGRTHRSGQCSAPSYKMVISNIGGEMRFAASIAKRMSSLGALTKGDRRAATGTNLSDFEFDSRFGRRGLKRFYDCMMVADGDTPYTPSKGSNVIIDSYIRGVAGNGDMQVEATSPPEKQRIQVLKDVKEGLTKVGIDSDTMKKSEVKAFLNRIAALTFAMQNLVFALFASTMDDVINEAKATGEYEGSVEDVRATSIELSADPEQITKDSSSGAPTKLAIFNVDRGFSLEKVCEVCQDMIPADSLDDEAIELSDDLVARSGFYMSKRPIMGRKLVLFAVRRVQHTERDGDDSTNRLDFDPFGMMVLTRPNTGQNPITKATDDLLQTYRLVASIDDVKELLQENNRAHGSNGNTDVLSVMTENHMPFTDLWQETHQVSNRFGGEGILGVAPRHSKLGIVTGAVLHCLPALEKSLAMRSLADRSLKIIRVEDQKNGQRMVGMRFPVDEDALQSLRSTMASLDATRNGSNSAAANDDDLFIDETPDPIVAKSVAWVSTAPKTMKSFFQTTKPKSSNSNPSSSSSIGSNSNNNNKRVQPSATTAGGDISNKGSGQSKKQKVQTEMKKKSIPKKATAITSFFKKLSDVR